MREVHLTEADVLTEAETDDLSGKKLDDAHYDRLFDDPEEDVAVYKPDGEPLAKVVRNAIPEDTAVRAYKALRPVAVQGGKNKGNRFQATGEDSRQQRTLEDGSVSDTMDVPKEISPNTGIVGYFDRYPRIPYCRQTAFNVNQPEQFAQAIPMFQACDDVFADQIPHRYENQLAKAKATEDDWLITETAFTTVTVNLNWQTACHTDAGDLKEGFGVMTVIRMGNYDGAYYIQPQYRTAYDLYTGDVILSDVHEWHGNGPFHETSGYYERLSCVLYYRRDMDECGTPAEERQHAQERRDVEGTPDDPDTSAEAATGNRQYEAE